jgi:tetratricopeptide (TPR) repeat protein
MIKKFWKKEKTSSAKQFFGSRGNQHIKNGDYNGAVMMYDEALKCEPTNTTLLLSRSLAQMMLTPPNLHLALQDADAAIQHCPTSWRGWLQKGETHLRMGNIKAAEEALMNAVGFAQGMDKLAAQRSLADIQSRCSKGSPVAGPSGTSVQSMSPTLFPEPSLHTTP